MKKTIRLLTMAALAVAGAVMAGCSGSDDIIDNPQPPTQKDNVVTVTTTISLAAGGGEEGGATTRALDPATGVKTFAVGERISVEYNYLSSKAISEPLTAGNISDGGKTATFTVTLTNPRAGQVTYVYPVGSDDYDNYYNNQDGSLETLQSTFDHSRGAGMMTVSDGTVTLPQVTLENTRAILAITFKDADGSNIITKDLNEVVIKDETSGLYTYTVHPKSGLTTFGQDVIYVAIEPTYSVSVNVNDGFYKYTKKMLTNKDYAAGNIYHVGWRMERTAPRVFNLDEATGNITLADGDVATGTLAGNYKVSIADGATVMLDGVTINGVNDEQYPWAGITCEGDATIILKEGTENTVKGFYELYSGIYVPVNKTLTIKGTGSLYASSNGGAAGIGAGYGSDRSCGNIEIQGGTIRADGGSNAAGIGGGGNAYCGNITITSGVTKVTAVKGSNAPDCVGKGYNASCGTVTIGGTVYWDGQSYQNGGYEYLFHRQWLVYSTSPLPQGSGDATLQDIEMHNCTEEVRAQSSHDIWDEEW